MDTDSSEAIQTARKAKELLDKLTEYKPLAKVEELEEQNYNMVDNVLNNGAESEEKKLQRGERSSLTERLSEKKSIVAGKAAEIQEKTSGKSIEQNVEEV